MNKFTLVGISLLLNVICQAQSMETPDTNVSNEVQPAYIHVSNDARIESLVEVQKELNKNKQFITGYTIQIYSGRREAAYDEKVSFIENFSEVPIDIIWEEPDYKVLAGHFRSKIDASELLTVLKESYPGAFILRKKIPFPEAKK